MRRTAASSLPLLCLCVTVTLVAACHDLPGAEPPPSTAGCEPTALEACERALVAAGAALAEGAAGHGPPPKAVEAFRAQLAAYALARGDETWPGLLTTLQAARGRVVTVTAGAAAIEGVDAELASLPEAAHPRAVGVEELLVAVGRAAGRKHLVYLPAGEGPARHLFPLDPMAPFTFGLLPVVEGARGRIAADIELGRSIEAVVAAGAAFDYVRAARELDTLQRLAEQGSPWAEPTLRARYLLRLAREGALALADANDDDETRSLEERAEGEALPGPSAFAYADLLMAQLAGERSAEVWAARGARVAQALGTPRGALLGDVFRAEGACASAPPPPVERVGDVAFGSVLARSLARGQEPGPRELTLDAWLARYERLVGLVERHGTMWSSAPDLLLSRGELHGLTAAGTEAYRRVTQLTLQHLAALDALARAEPARFRPLPALLLALQPGLQSDRQLVDRATALLERAVEGSLAAAADSDAAFEAALSAMVSAWSAPPNVRDAQLSALGTGLRKLLSGPLASATGWQTAALHAGVGLLSLLSGQTDAFVASSKSAAATLEGRAAGPYASLQPLGAAAARYAGLIGEDALDLGVSAPASFVPSRKAAFDALESALRRLDGGGPEGLGDEQLLADTAALADGLVAVGARRIRSGGSEGPACEGTGAAAHPAEIISAYGRLAALRRRLVARPSFKSPTGAWARRARLVGLVLSDLLDLSDPRPAVRTFALDNGTAVAILDAALADWSERDAAAAIGGTHRLFRAVAGQEKVDPAELVAGASSLFSALGRLFASEGERQRRSIFDTLVEASRDAKVGSAAELADLFASYADSAYRNGVPEQGDLLAFGAMAVAVALEQPVPQRAVDMARTGKRPVLLPLLMSAHVDSSGDQTELFQVMRATAAAQCRPPDVEPVIAFRKAVADFRAGRRSESLAALEAMLTRAEAVGLEVPRVDYVYLEETEQKVFKLEGGFSLGSVLLSNSNALKVGLGLRSQGEPTSKLTVTFADPTSADAAIEGTRFYAHAAAVTASLHFVAGDRDRAVHASRRAISAWAVGMRLGDRPVPSGDNVGTWAADATPVIAMLASQASDAGLAFLTGDLLTLARAALGPSATDADVADAVDAPPKMLAGIAELDATAKRAAEMLRAATGDLACTTTGRATARFAKVDCDSYPLALGLRVAGALDVLPRLRAGAEAGDAACGAWRALDGFLDGVEGRRYDPDAFLGAISALRTHGRTLDAATLLTRHRHPNHCTPVIVDHAHELAAQEKLGAELRADLVSVAANCGAGGDESRLAADLLQLDTLTRQHPLPMRNLEVALFTMRLALDADRWGLLARLADRPDFVRRWIPYGPRLATFALLAYHAAKAGAGEPIDAQATLPYYRLLCTTYPPEERGAQCNSISLLRGSGSADEKKRAAVEAVKTLLAQLSSQP